MKPGIPNDLWFYLKDPVSKEVLDGQLHVIIAVETGRLVQPDDEIKKTDQALISHTKTSVTKKVTRKRVIGADGQARYEDVQVTTNVSKGNLAPVEKMPDGISSTSFSPVQPTAMLEQPGQKKKKSANTKVCTFTFTCNLQSIACLQTLSHPTSILLLYS